MQAPTIEQLDTTHCNHSIRARSSTVPTELELPRSNSKASSPDSGSATVPRAHPNHPTLDTKQSDTVEVSFGSSVGTPPPRRGRPRLRPRTAKSRYGTRHAARSTQHAARKSKFSIMSPFDFLNSFDTSKIVLAIICTKAFCVLRAACCVNWYNNAFFALYLYYNES